MIIYIEREEFILNPNKGYVDKRLQLNFLKITEGLRDLLKLSLLFNLPFVHEELNMNLHRIEELIDGRKSP